MKHNAFPVQQPATVLIVLLGPDLEACREETKVRLRWHEYRPSHHSSKETKEEVIANAELPCAAGSGDDRFATAPVHAIYPSEQGNSNGLRATTARFENCLLGLSLVSPHTVRPSHSRSYLVFIHLAGLAAKEAGRGHIAVNLEPMLGDQKSLYYSTIDETSRHLCNSHRERLSPQHAQCVTIRSLREARYVPCCTLGW